MPSEQDIQNQQELLATHRQHLFKYLKQQAEDGEEYASPALVSGIDKVRGNIRRVKAILRDWGVTVEDHPDDEAS
jgi:hypothetical protein